MTGTQLNQAMKAALITIFSHYPEMVRQAV
jgi:hypothetical protein